MARRMVLSVFAKFLHVFSDRVRMEDFDQSPLGSVEDGPGSNNPSTPCSNVPETPGSGHFFKNSFFSIFSRFLGKVAPYIEDAGGLTPFLASPTAGSLGKSSRSGQTLMFGRYVCMNVCMYMYVCMYVSMYLSMYRVSQKRRVILN